MSLYSPTMYFNHVQSMTYTLEKSDSNTEYELKVHFSFYISFLTLIYRSLLQPDGLKE